MVPATPRLAVTHTVSWCSGTSRCATACRTHLGPGQGLRVGRVRQHGGEAAGPEAGQILAFARHALDLAGHSPQDLVARRMTVDVIDVAEEIQVEQDAGDLVVARIHQLALQAIAKRRVAQQSGQRVHGRLLAHPPLVLDDTRSGAEAGQQFAEHDRLGQEVIDAGHHRVRQPLDLGVAQHQERIRVALAAPGKQLAALLHAQAVAIDDQEVGGDALQTEMACRTSVTGSTANRRRSETGSGVGGSCGPPRPPSIGMVWNSSG